MLRVFIVAFYTQVIVKHTIFRLYSSACVPSQLLSCVENCDDPCMTLVDSRIVQKTAAGCSGLFG